MALGSARNGSFRRFINKRAQTQRAPGKEKAILRFVFIFYTAPRIQRPDNMECVLS
jgi:hypothetical protein